MRNISIIILIFVISGIFFLPLIVTPGSIFKGTDYPVSISWKSFVKEELNHGRLPLWNPNDRTGFPYFAHPGTAIWYPPDIIFAFFPVITSLILSLYLHILLACSFTYLFARSLNLSKISSLTAAACFVLAGYIPMHLVEGHKEILQPVCWIPVIFYFLHKYYKTLNKKFLILSGLSFGIQLLGPYPTVSVYTLEALFFYAIFAAPATLRIRISALLKISLMAIGLSAILLIPFMELSSRITRNAGYTYEQSTLGSLPFSFLVAFVNPFAFGDPLSSSYTGPELYNGLSHYPGIFTLALVVVSLFALKKNLFSSRAFLIIALVMLFIAFGKYNPFYKILWDLSVFYQKTRIPSRQLILFCFGIAMLAGIGSHFLKKNFLRILFLLLIVLDLSMFGKKFITIINSASYFGDQTLFSYLSKDHSLYRLYPTYDVYSVNLRSIIGDLGTPLIYNIATVKTYDPFILKTYHDFTNSIEGISYYDEYNTPLSNTTSSLLNFLNAKYFLTPPGLDLSKQDPKRFTKVLDSPNYKLFENKNVLPRFYLDPPSPRSSLEITKNLPTEIEFKIYSESETRLVSSEMYYPGWQTEIDGQKSDFGLMYDTFKSQTIPKGTHNIKWYFLPYSLLLGAVISILTFFLTIFAFFLPGKIKKEHA